MARNIKETLREFVISYGWRGILALLFYPVISFLTTPFCMLKSIWNCRVLADGKDWKYYPHFSPHSAINGLCYWTRALNFSRFGRSGRSPYIGLGDYDLGRGFHYSFMSFYAYWKAGAVTLLLGMFGWWIAHAFWLDQPGVRLSWYVSVLLLTLISTTFYAHTFACQNYNVLGWIFFPMGLYGWATGNWALATVAWLAASFGSFTVVFLAAMLSAIYALQLLSFAPIFSILPSILKLSTHFWPNIKNKNIRRIVVNLAKGVGMTRRNVKYHRKKMMQFGMTRIYRLVTYLQYVIVFFITTESLSVLMITSLLIWILNSSFFRFGDEESMEILILSVAVFSLLDLSQGNIWLLLSYWFLASPIPILASFPSSKEIAVVPIFSPVDIRPLLNECERFLDPLERGSRVLMAFDDPKGQYEKIFDGYRYLLELPLYVASKKEFHLMPDWWGVFEINYEGAPDFWGRDVETVGRQMKAWHANYVIIYQTAGTPLDKKWGKNGFKALGSLSWAHFENFFAQSPPYPGPTPDWWLLTREEA